jgi:hypothetical protein
MTQTRRSCFCGSTDHPTATCRHCRSVIVRHSEPGLTGWFAKSWFGAPTFADGDCARAPYVMHVPAR